MSQDESCIIPDCPTLPEVIMAGLAYKDFRMAVRGDVVHINYDSNAFQFSTPANFNPELIVAAFQPKEQDNVPAQLPPDAGNYDG